MKLVAVLVIFLTSALQTNAQNGSGPTEPAYLYRAHVVRVVDGDTIDVDIDLGFYIWIKKQRIRLVEIDAPSMRGKDREAGLAAASYLTDLIDGKVIIIRTIKGPDGGEKRGKFGRWLGRIYLDGIDINQHMIDVGHAEAY